MHFDVLRELCGSTSVGMQSRPSVERCSSKHSKGNLVPGMCRRTAGNDWSAAEDRALPPRCMPLAGVSQHGDKTEVAMLRRARLGGHTPPDQERPLVPLLCSCRPAHIGTSPTDGRPERRPLSFGCLREFRAAATVGMCRRASVADKTVLNPRRTLVSGLRPQPKAETRSDARPRTRAWRHVSVNNVPERMHASSLGMHVRAPLESTPRQRQTESPKERKLVPRMLQRTTDFSPERKHRGRQTPGRRAQRRLPLLRIPWQ
jgi:hypothetical protein